MLLLIAQCLLQAGRALVVPALTEEAAAAQGNALAGAAFCLEDEVCIQQRYIQCILQRGNNLALGPRRL
jgi:hypothetical protein